MPHQAVVFHRSILLSLMQPIVLLLSVFIFAHPLAAADAWVKYPGGEGPGKGKHIVLISGDEEYRSEEALPQLAKILSTEHGFDCTVLFAVDPQTDLINPNYQKNIPGLAALTKADLVILFTRFRDLPEDQLQLIDDYVKAGKPIIGIRTATHAFMPKGSSRFEHYGNAYAGERKEWEGGFGRVVLGEQWVNHHGKHKHESTRGIISPGAEDHPIVRGIASGEIWGPSDVYAVRLPLPGDSKPLVLGQITNRKGEYNENDRLYGMRPDDGPAATDVRNNPMMPIAWVRTYQLPGGKPGRAFMSTIGASTDLLNEATRRLLVNAAYWCAGLENQIPKNGCRVDLVGKYEPTKFEFRTDDYWAKRKLTVDEIRADAPDAARSVAK
jgi:hypothetical protein